MSLSNVQMNSSQRDEDSFIRGVKDCIPTLLGYLSIGLAAGVIQKTAGLSIAEIALMSLILYAGSAQFIAAGMIATSSSLPAIIITIFFVNLRHILLSAALAPYFRHLSPLRNMLVGSLLTDETFGVAITEAAKKKRISEKWMHGLNITAYVNWLIANVAGAFLAQWISNPEKFGLEFALPSMFIGILILSMLGRNKIKLDIVVAIIAVVIAVGSSFVFSSSMGVIVATIIASTIGMVVEKWR
ncbi:AzlC family ABC transporter permease [Paenibacillus sp. MER TA 81-3]|uniref:AzlC family ABC transporter permease n=1 Tax=Paenibacillus sp. MER TA 81-3 TaxID=2939573 RepID=UPI002040CB87|nr:AzlC family ABC transporter permease [Paenibacillus sp. MER TA 81-3]MCM3342688.1 AzlC family ABC transporter permease [Paenibacillus sp. MER TA 81-3]